MPPDISGTLEIVQTSVLPIAVRRRGSGPPILFCHGTACSSRCFEKQLDSALADNFELVAIDLPGHGDSPPAANPERTYTIRGYAEVLAASAIALGVPDAVFVGWSLGGHVLLAARDRLPQGSGFLIFGTPPVASFAEFASAVTDDPALAAAFQEDVSDEEVRAVVSLFFRPGQAIPAIFLDDFRRTDPRSRSLVGADAAAGNFADEVQIVADTGARLAVLHGVEEQLIKRAYFDGVSMPTLWRGAVQEVPEAGHAAQWENPAVFNRLLEEFAADCARRT